jgi:hypothetical protein
MVVSVFSLNSIDLRALSLLTGFDNGAASDYLVRH